MAAGGSDMASAFAKFATKANGTEATSKDLTRWLTDCGVITKKSCNSNNLDIAFSKVKTKGKNVLTTKELDALVAELAKTYKVDFKCDSVEDAISQIKDKMLGAELKQHGVTKVSATGGVDRMTDTSKYTGSHKERFDDSGKGKGAEGRVDAADNSGYVGNYKGAESYDKDR